MNCLSCKNTGGLQEIVLTHGRTAVPGCVEGTVRVVLDPKDADHLLADEVLVTPMTDPDSVPAMQRSVAVVTERGGMLCHAAIVCREMNKPCVVGTNNATTKLTNGARVRVCASRGLILAVSDVRVLS